MSITAQAKPEELVQFNVRLPRRMLARLSAQAYYHRLKKKEVVVAALDVHLAKLERAGSSDRPARKP
jgi:hypothetical protein